MYLILPFLKGVPVIRGGILFVSFARIRPPATTAVGHVGQVDSYYISMSGHNKWSQIKEKKSKTDGAKSKIFSKFAKLITEEAKKAKGNKDAPGLKAVITRAHDANMPNENIDRAIKKATEAGGAQMESITYEAYGPGGCAMIIEALTDNKNKAAQEVKFILSEFGFSLAGIGSATWAFKKEGVGWKPTTTIPLGDEDVATLQKLAEKLEDNDEVQAVFTNAE